MSNRYQQLTYASGAMAPGAVLNTNTTGLPSLFNIVKVKVVPDAGGGTFDFRVYKADTFDPTKLLDHWDDVPGVSLFEPADNATGTLLEALEGYPFPYDDDDNSGEFHSQLINNDTASHSYTVTVWYEEVPKFGAAGGATLRSYIQVGDGAAATPSISFTNAPSNGWFLNTSTRMGGVISGVERISVRSSEININGVPLGIDSGTSGTGVSYLYSESANVFAMKNGANVQEFRVHGSATKYFSISHNGTDSQLLSSSGNILVNAILYGSSDNTYDFGGSSNRWKIGYFGTSVRSGDGSAATPSFAFGNDVDTGWWRLTTNQVTASAGGTPSLTVTAGGLQLLSGSALSWSTSGVDPTGASDVLIKRFAGHTAGMEDGLNANAWRVYGTTTGSKYVQIEHGGTDGGIYTSSGALTVYTVTDSTLFFGSNNGVRWASAGSSNGYAFYPAVDNTYDSGLTSNRIRTGYFGTSVSIGTNPAAAGLVRLSNNDGVVWRNATNTGEAAAFYCDSGNNVTLDGTAGAGIYLNVSAKDTNVILRSASNNSHFVSDAGAFGNVGAFGFGAVANGASFFAIDPPAIAAAANSNYARVYVGNAGAVTIPVGTAGIVASIYVEEPNVIATGTVTDAYSIAILAAPTEAGRNGGLWNKAVTRLDDFLEWRNSSGVLAVNEYASTKTLTDNVATDLFTVANSADGDFSGVTIEYAIMVDSGGNIQVESGFATIAIYNNGGTQNAQIVKVGTPAAVASTGTLTVTFSSTNVGGGRKVQVTADSSLNFDSTIRYKIVNHSAKAITIN